MTRVDDHIMIVIFVKDYSGCGSRLFSKAVMGENEENQKSGCTGKTKAEE